MYRLYCINQDEENKEKVSECMYRRVFDKDPRNLWFHRPKKDQCDTCIAYKNHHGLMSEETRLQFEKHLENKNTARYIKKCAKEDKDPLKTSCAFDFQQIMLCPHGQSSKYYYKRRLGVYNLSFYDYTNADAFCYMWHEGEGNRGANEVATCMYKYIENQKINNGKKEINMFSDNCPGQNKNKYVAFAINFFCRHFKLNKLTHTFLEKGHTETENDAVHAIIERKTRHIYLYTPDQWFAAVKNSKGIKTTLHCM